MIRRFEIEKILDEKGTSGAKTSGAKTRNKKYLVKWKGLDDEYNEWMDEKKINEIHGNGFFTDLYYKITNSYPGKKALEDLFLNHKNVPIVKIEVGRVAVQSGLIKLVNVFSLGKFSQAQKTTSYDELFHLFLNIYLANGYNFRLEKLPHPTISPFTGIINDADIMNVPLEGRKIPLLDLINRTIGKMGKDFYTYSPLSNNCQKFVSMILIANNLMTEQLNNFINQNLSQIEKAIPGASKSFYEAVTDLTMILRNN